MIIIQEIGTAQGPRLYWLHQDPIFRILLNITVKTLNDKTERWDYGQAQKLHGIQMSNESSCVLISFRCIPIKNHMWNHPCISILKVLHNYRFTDLQKILHQEKLKTCQPFHDWWNRQCYPVRLQLHVLPAIYLTVYCTWITIMELCHSEAHCVRLHGRRF